MGLTIHTTPNIIKNIQLRKRIKSCIYKVDLRMMDEGCHLKVSASDGWRVEFDVERRIKEVHLL
jgi:hypothetical protein